MKPTSFDLHRRGRQRGRNAGPCGAARRAARIWWVDGVGTGRLPPSGLPASLRPVVAVAGVLPWAGWACCCPAAGGASPQAVRGGRAVLFCGGINDAGRFHDPNHGALDAPALTLRCVPPAALVLQTSDAMEQLWWRMQAVRDVRKRRLPSPAGAAQPLSAMPAHRDRPAARCGARTAPGAATTFTNSRAQLKDPPACHWLRARLRGHHCQRLLRARPQAAQGLLMAAAPRRCAVRHAAAGAL